MLVSSKLLRAFKFDNQIIEDFNPALTPEEIKEHLSGSYPQLTNAKILNKGIQDDKILFEFQTIIGTKG